jgi:hypothetical protein
MWPVLLNDLLRNAWVQLKWRTKTRVRLPIVKVAGRIVLKPPELAAMLSRQWSSRQRQSLAFQVPFKRLVLGGPRNPTYLTNINQRSHPPLIFQSVELQLPKKSCGHRQAATAEIAAQL